MSPRALNLMIMRVAIVRTSACLFIIQCLLMRFVQCQEDLENDYNINGLNSTQLNDTRVVNEFTAFVYEQLTGVTTNLIHSDIAKRAAFCVTDPQDDWNRSFNYSNNLDFLSKCIVTTQGDFPQRLCTAAELKFYFSNFIASSKSSFLQPNRNCNVTQWVSGCEPGWACRTDLTRPVVDYVDSVNVPHRTSDCQPCCEGFFCPQGLTCMIPCPLGSYCPVATFNDNTGLCDPYSYQLPPGKTNHTCGGANIWADVGRGSSMFCSAGSYCPTNTQEIPCADGHYCRMGSTSETRCFSLTSCDSNTTRQNITQYGLLVIFGTSALLVILYNCCDQVIIIREKRYARSREAAVKTVREKSLARRLAAEEAIRNRSIEHQSQSSRSFSSRIIVVPDEQENEESSDYSEYMCQETIDKGNSKRFKVKHIRTDSQIFRYAYSQLEKEKSQQHQNRDLSFSGVRSLEMYNETLRRPPVEISFRDLTVTLKTKKKHLLRSLTGEIRPGHITALMGPSGAGKTTLLSALAGKTVGCSITGLILVNGKKESIHSYKKIVGFVPQDDVVHGNLTVEENIWFSANCRLSAYLPKPDKVLVVERVIESLGLQAVRDCLVGTVEKRGISGGQRKRVNVGLELVMEPSLLFLDEPTSGLDSSSSQLLLYALRREALEGVNICTVVHQPSYALFKMFDDLILLAKGGRTVYHGPVKNVEDYFANLGIEVPERINPPDYFIDVLEGMTTLSANTAVKYDQLPLIWILHNGYSVPEDMQKHVSELGVTIVPVDQTDQNSCTGSETNQLSFWAEFWQSVKYRFEVRYDVVRNSFFKSKDLSRRQTPSIILQYKHFVVRMAKQRMREARIQSIDYVILLLAGACLGLITKASDENFGGPGYSYTIIATSLLCKIAALRTFSLDKLQFRRERASGISSLAHFVAKDTIDHFNTSIKPLVYLSSFYFFSTPRSSFFDNYLVLLFLVYCVTGIAYALAIFLEPGPAQLCSVLLPVVLTLLSTQPQDRKLIKTLAKLCYPRWALEGFVVLNAKRYYGVWLIQRCGALLKADYNLHDWYIRISLLAATGAAFRVLAFLGMLTLQKK